VDSDGETRISPVEAKDEDGSGDDEEKGNGSEDAVRADQIVIEHGVPEAIAHS
jgi:hypothetical protein